MVDFIKLLRERGKQEIESTTQTISDTFSGKVANLIEELTDRIEELEMKIRLQLNYIDQLRKSK